jgi:hypothetical protein
LVQVRESHLRSVPSNDGNAFATALPAPVSVLPYLVLQLFRDGIFVHVVNQILVVRMYAWMVSKCPLTTPSVNKDWRDSICSARCRRENIDFIGIVFVVVYAMYNI